MLTLEGLPVELLYEIFVFAMNENFPHASRHLYSVLKNAPSSIQAEYIVLRSLPTDDLPSKILRFPICTLPVLESLFRNPSYATLLSKHSRVTTKLPRHLFQTLAPKPRPRGVRMDRRQIEQWTSEDAPIPLLRFLLEKSRFPRPDWNYREGYPLTKAIMAGFIPLVRFLLENGASPGCKDGLAVRIAINKRDLGLVKMLIEPDASVKDSDGRRVRRRRMEDRVRVGPEMLKVAVKVDAKDIVEYFMKEKGCVPDMQTVLMMTA